MKPTIVIVGRPNVGKSTLFNRLTRSREAIVADAPGITRDRHYGEGRVGDKPYLVVDTGGFEPVAREGIFHEMARQTRQAVDEADGVLFVVDARAGLTAQDEIIADELRKTGRKIWLIVNKSEGMPPAMAAADFHALGVGEPLAVSAAHGENISDLMEIVLADLPDRREPSSAEVKHPKIAIVGRPNVGKSTLINALLGEERVIVFDEPGTTRDAIYVEFERDNRHYTLIDTAGLRKRGRVVEAADKFSVVKTMQAIADANVAILVLDARQEISEQDAHIAGFILEAGRALVVAVNKWEGLPEHDRDMVKRVVARKLNFLNFARLHFISALHGQGIGSLLNSVDAAYRAAMARLPTPKLTRALQAALVQQQPPRAGYTRPKLRYAHQGGANPPRIIIHGNSLEHVPDSYRRYLERFFRDAFKLEGTPLKVEFKTGRNPYARARLPT
ncbi:MAG: ribosome biogenesis GTPase Der [Betaproteobacteria bacterium RIFCSPLOWO2_12_FULL_62_58]|nr:MAG: ribosome biogenesis GTPase Der [Betaproteobacteria bacterium RIFCSPLOWO2_02_FULL_62_79]OGA46056.1 MAG: ribosome biogenesis GTPase Der [Betaproteobacteria bacterium RIFCSPLOWO2_12_FULL_62_58]